MLPHAHGLCLFIPIDSSVKKKREKHPFNKALWGINYLALEQRISWHAIALCVRTNDSKAGTPPATISVQMNSVEHSFWAGTDHWGLLCQQNLAYWRPWSTMNHSYHNVSDANVKPGAWHHLNRSQSDYSQATQLIYKWMSRKRKSGKEFWDCQVKLRR